MLINKNFSTQAQRPVSAPKVAAQPAPQELEAASPKSADEVTWSDVGRGLVGSVVAASITTVGNTLSSIPQSVELLAEAEVALVKNQTLGPWLKGGIGLLALAAVPVGIAATAIGSLGFGLYRGFTEGIKTGIGGATQAAVENVKGFNTEVVGNARTGLREFGDKKLEAGEEKFDVSPLRAGVGVAAGLGTTLQGAAQFGWTTAKNVPAAFLQTNSYISESSMGTPLKTASHIITAPLAAVAVPAGFVGGALVGLGVGVYAGYREGFVESFKGVNALNTDYNELADKYL